MPDWEVSMTIEIVLGAILAIIILSVYPQILIYCLIFISIFSVIGIPAVIAHFLGINWGGGAGAGALVLFTILRDEMKE